MSSTTQQLIAPATQTPWPLTKEERSRVEKILEQNPQLALPYAELELEDAVLVQRYFTGRHPIRARQMVLKSRGEAPAGDVT